MELALNNGFMELNSTEMEMVDGGGALGTIAGVALIVGGVAVVAAVMCANPVAGIALADFAVNAVGPIVTGIYLVSQY